MPSATTNNTTPTLRSTSTVFDAALSRMPITSTPVTRSRIATAGKLNQAPVLEKGSLLRYQGTSQLRQILVSLLKYSDHADATVAQLIAYSRMRSQPMIQASNSPRVA